MIRVLLVASYSAVDFYSTTKLMATTANASNSPNSAIGTSTSINFMTTDWNMITIDDLKQSDIDPFFKIMSMKLREFFDEPNTLYTERTRANLNAAVDQEHE